MYRIIVSFGSGSLTTGFDSVSITLLDHDGTPQSKRVCKLPSQPKLIELTTRWKRLYRSYYLNAQWPSRLEILSEDEDPYSFSKQSFWDCCQQLKETLNEWLETSDFSAVIQVLRGRLDYRQSFQWIIESNTSEIQNLPWHLWDFFAEYPASEVAISLPEFEQITPSSQPYREQLKILVILGKTINDIGDEINVQKDRQTIESLPNVSTIFLDKTSRSEVSDLLWEKSWDIVLFAGHSSGSEHRGKAGFLINSDEADNFISIDELKDAFQSAIQKGLQLVIFNSCDSFELGIELMRLNLPQCIAMSEAIPDAVAQRFLRYLIQQWSEERSFIIAVRKARARLKESEDPMFPCASWLPIICQNPAAAPPLWPQSTDSPASPPPKPKPTKNWKQSLIKGVSVSGLVLGLRFLGGLEALELGALDQLFRWSPPEQTDETILLVTIGEADIQYQDQQNMPRKGSLSDVALNQLLQKLQPLSPKVVNVDIFHDFPYTPQLQKTIDGFPAFQAVCEVGFSLDNEGSIEPPPKLSLSQIGFTDLVLDTDERIRRQLLQLKPSNRCPTPTGLGVRLAEGYLATKIHTDRDTGHLKLGSLSLPQLNPRSGGYRLPDIEASGYQIMTHYRRAQFDSMSLREILSESNQSQFEDLARDRLIIIGLKQRSRDSLYTPIGHGFTGKMAGIEVHAHMASQLIQAVENQRPLLWWWPEWLESFWIVGWSILGTGVLILKFNTIRKALIMLGLGAIATLISFLLFLQGGWIPLVPILLSLLLLISLYGIESLLKIRQKLMVKSS